MLQISATFNVIGSPAEVAYIANLLAGQTEFAAKVDSSLRLNEDARILLGAAKAEAASADRTPAETIAKVFQEPIPEAPSEVEREVAADVADLEKTKAERDTTPAQETPPWDGAPPDYDTTAAYITRLSTEKGMPAARAVLAKFDAKRLPDVDPARYQDVINAAQEALAS